MVDRVVSLNSKGQVQITVPRADQGSDNANVNELREISVLSITPKLLRTKSVSAVDMRVARLHQDMGYKAKHSADISDLTPQSIDELREKLIKKGYMITVHYRRRPFAKKTHIQIDLRAPKLIRSESV